MFWASAYQLLPKAALYQNWEILYEHSPFPFCTLSAFFKQDYSKLFNRCFLHIYFNLPLIWKRITEMRHVLPLILRCEGSGLLKSAAISSIPGLDESHFYKQKEIYPKDVQIASEVIRTKYLVALVISLCVICIFRLWITSQFGCMCLSQFWKRKLGS